MNALLFSVAFGAVCASALAQGTLNFANLAPGVNAPVTDQNGVKLSGPQFMADLFWAPGVVFDSSALTALNEPAPFRNGGYFLGGPRTIPGQGAGATITAQVRVWAVAYGSSWAQARMTPGALTAESLLVTVTLTSPPDLPPSLIGLQPFSQSICLSCSQPWPVAVVVQASGPNGLRLSWPAYLNAGRYRVQQNPDLDPTHWVTFPDQPALGTLPPNGAPEFQITLPSPPGKMFYRLVWQ